MKDSFKGKDIIKHNFYSMYKSMPLEKIRVKELAALSGVSRSTFYFYYEDVYDLYNECQDEMMEFLESGLSDIVMSTIVRDRERYIEYVSKDMLRYLDILARLRVLLNGSKGVEFQKIYIESVRKAYSKAMDFSGAVHTREGISQYGPSRTEGLRSMRYKEKMARFYAAGHCQLLMDWIDEENHSEDVARLYAAVSADAMFMGTFI